MLSFRSAKKNLDQFFFCNRYQRSIVFQAFVERRDCKYFSTFLHHSPQSQRCNRGERVPPRVCVGVHVVWLCALTPQPFRFRLPVLCRLFSLFHNRLRLRPGSTLMGGSRGIPSARNPRFAAREVVAYVRTISQRTKRQAFPTFYSSLVNRSSLFFHSISPRVLSSSLRVSTLRD